MHERSLSSHGGILSVLTLISVVCLAVLAVLSLTYAHDASTAAQRQRDTVVASYQNETDAQTWLASVDASLKSQGSSSSAEGGSSSVGETIARTTDATYAADSNRVSKTFVNGPVSLTASLSLHGSTYQIESWNTASTTDTNEHVTLWSGANNAQ